MVSKSAMIWWHISFLFSVEGGHRAIIFARIGGIQDDVMVEGLHFRIPWFQYPIIYDIRSRPRKISSPTGSKDLQMVNISLRVLSRPDAGMIPQIHKGQAHHMFSRFLNLRFFFTKLYVSFYRGLQSVFLLW